MYPYLDQYCQKDVSTVLPLAMQMVASHSLMLSLAGKDVYSEQSMPPWLNLARWKPALRIHRIFELREPHNNLRHGEPSGLMSNKVIALTLQRRL